MKAFADLVYKLELCRTKESKLEAFENFLETSENPDILWAIYTFLYKKPKRIITQRVLRSWAIEYAKLEEWIFEESMKIVGDLNETSTLIVPKPDTFSEETFSFWMKELLGLYQLGEENIKAWVCGAWSTLDAKQRLVLNKLLTGSFRMSLPLSVISQGISSHIKKDVSSIAHRLIRKWTPINTSFEELFFDDDERDILAKPLDLKRPIVYDSKLESLGYSDQWLAEWKWIGMRAQYISRGGEVFLWTSHMELLNPYFPEIISDSSTFNSNFVLDGILIPYKDGVPLDFSFLGRRLGKKNTTKALIRENPVVFMAFDILELDEKELNILPFYSRRIILEEHLELLDTNNIVLSELISFDTWKELSRQSKSARMLKTDGFVLKRKKSVYNNQEDYWIKWKVEPLEIDAILIYAHRSSGWIGRNYVEFSFALRQADKLITLTKAPAELDDDEMMEIVDFVKANTIERFGPVYSVSPELVFRLSFDSVQESKRHKSGIVLRNPKIVKWLKDTGQEEANTIGDVRKLIE